MREKPLWFSLQISEGLIMRQARRPGCLGTDWRLISAALPCAWRAPLTIAVVILSTVVVPGWSSSGQQLRESIHESNDSRGHENSFSNRLPGVDIQQHSGRECSGVPDSPPKDGELLTDSLHFSSADLAPGLEPSDTPSFHDVMTASHAWDEQSVRRRDNGGALKGFNEEADKPPLATQKVEPSHDAAPVVSDFERDVRVPKGVNDKALRPCISAEADDVASYDAAALQGVDEALEKEALGPIENISMFDLVVDIGVVSEKQLLEGVEIPPIVWQRHLQQQRLLARHRRLFPRTAAGSLQSKCDGTGVRERGGRFQASDANGQDTASTLDQRRRLDASCEKGNHDRGLVGLGHNGDMLSLSEKQVSDELKHAEEGGAESGTGGKIHKSRGPEPAAEGKSRSGGARAERKALHDRHDRYDSDDSWLVTSSEINLEARTAHERYLQTIAPSIYLGADAAQGAHRHGAGKLRRKGKKGARKRSAPSAGDANSSSVPPAPKYASLTGVCVRQGSPAHGLVGGASGLSLS